MIINKLARKNIRDLIPYSSARSQNTSGVLLDANENSFGSVCGSKKLNRYPDPNHKNSKKMLSEYLKVKEENLFLGSGSDEIIDLLIRTFCEPSQDKVLVFEPSYGMYEISALINSVSVIKSGLKNNFQPDLNVLEKIINSEFPKIVFFCSPNNPTGNIINKEIIYKICSLNKCIVVIDEAYMDFDEEKSLLKEKDKFDNLVIIRTFSKAWGLAGIRAGYCIANLELIDLLYKIKLPYNISSNTLEQIEKAVLKKSKKNLFVSKIIKEREFMKRQLRSYTFINEVYDSSANFLLIRSVWYKQILDYLKKENIIVRDRSSQYMLEDCIRISIGNKSQNKLLLKKLKELQCKILS